ncbi:MAG TPA: RC-LH1 core complex protein PufX [Paracoccaceae bacterium]|nr:RC-LH1 core complex protein PufX [Paracoccaceae bacterium]HMO72615.1 RC-LH1 core complex protein PufX [Paracoccaceae bacterium]
MSEKNYFDETPAGRLRSWILTQMMRGAGYAALLVFGVMVLIYAVYLLGLLLPPESKTAPSPMGFVIEAPADTRAA